MFNAPELRVSAKPVRCRHAALTRAHPRADVADPIPERTVAGKREGAQSECSRSRLARTTVPAGGARRGLPDGGRTKVAEATTVRRLATHHLVSEYCRWRCWSCGQSSQPISDATNGVDLRRQAPGGLENVTAGSMPTASAHRLGGFAAISRGLSEGRSVSRNPERGNATPRREQNRASSRRDAPCR